MNSSRGQAVRVEALITPGFPENKVSPNLLSQLAAIVESSDDAIFSRTLDGTVTTWNPAAERIFGYTPAEIINRSGDVLVPPKYRDEFQELIARVCRGEVVRHFETERRGKDGEPVLVSLTFSPIRDTSHRLIGFSTIARDITEQRLVRRALMRRERELEDLFEEASVGLVVLGPNGEVLRANRAFLNVLECPASEIVERPLRTFHADGAQFDELLDRLAQHQTLHNVLTELRTRKGRPKSVLVDANALRENGAIVYSRWFVRDISMRKQLERELLEISERERRGFAQELHDGLGQQLGGIAYLSNVLRERLEKRQASEAAEAKRIFMLVRNAIDQTRRVARNLSPIPEGPDGLMMALGELAAQTAEVFQVRCRFDCRKSILIEDSGLAAHLYRIAQEAVNNALKHAQPRAVTIRLRRDRNRILLAILDNGRSIRAPSRKREGLGLRIMNYRAGLVRGNVTVRPRKSGGTEVVCTVPLRSVERPKAAH